MRFGSLNTWTPSEDLPASISFGCSLGRFVLSFILDSANGKENETTSVGDFFLSILTFSPL